MEELSLGEFVAWYKPYYKVKHENDDDNKDLEDVITDDEETEMDSNKNKAIKLKDGKSFIKNV